MHVFLIGIITLPNFFQDTISHQESCNSNKTNNEIFFIVFFVYLVIDLLLFFFYSRSIYVGAQISFLYTWRLYGLDPDSDEYKEAMKYCHHKGAECLRDGCLQNGGLYVKLGQGLVSLNHLLPTEYITILSSLQDRALSRGVNEVSIRLA